jgi:sugar lactone lactonase YvrE
VADTDNDTIRRITSSGLVSTLAGLAGSSGSVDGVGSEARFDQPYGVAVDSAGNVYVADHANNTIRQVTPAGVVTTLAGLAGSTGSNDGMGSAARFDHPYGVAVNSAGTVYVSDYLNSTIRQVTPAGVVTTLAGLAGNAGSADGTGSAARFNEPASLAVDSAGNVYVADSANSTIRLVTPAGVVTTLAGQAEDYGDSDGTGTNALFFAPLGVAVDSATNLYVADTYNSTIRKIIPVGGSWVVSTIAGSLDQVGRYGFANGAGSGAVFNLPQSVAVDSAGNVYVADTDNNTIRKGVFSQYVPANPMPVSQPGNNATLVVILLPPQANGQWRFPWEQSWRQSGTAASNLAPNQNYTVEFSQVPGYLPIPAEVTVNVTAGQSTDVTGTYFPTITSVDQAIGGSLQVFFQVNPPSGAGWRLLGDADAFLPSGFATNLLPGNYLIEFASLANFIRIPILSVQVSAGLPTVVQEIYQPSQPPPAGVLLPTPVPSSQISDLTDYPYGFNGQLSTDAGFGSGVAVQPNVVLTAAHLIFDDQSLSYVSQAWWYPQEDAPQFVPQPQLARGWLVLSGYASQRTNDLQSGLYSADQSSPQSRNFDVAALYFSSPVAGGGYGGYLPSDASPNSWLTSTAEKMCVGYPVDGSMFQVPGVVPGQMCQIGSQPYPLSLATDPAVDQQVYTASWFLGYPGESGGPLYVQFDGYFYPAGVYLGTLFNGTVPYASAVRAIDGNVAGLITNAQNFVATGTNNSGGGIITIIPTGVSSSHPAFLIVTLGPPAAVSAGAAWEFVNQPATDFLSASQSVQELSSSATVGLQFQSIPGWNLPPNQTLSLVAGENTCTASYALAISWSPQTPITYGTPLGSSQLNATTVDPQGSYNYNFFSGSVLDAGSYTLSVTFTSGDTADYGNASATTNVSLVVAPAPLTVTAANASRAFGQGNPAFTGAITGLQNGDNITATYSCNATASSPPGTYSIVPVLVDPDNRLGNYQVTLADGTLTVTTPVVTTAPVIQSTSHSGNSFTFTWSATVNQTYQIQSTPKLAQPEWANLGAPLNATNAVMTTFQVISANSQQFYRVVLLP